MHTPIKGVHIQMHLKLNTTLLSNASQHAHRQPFKVALINSNQIPDVLVSFSSHFCCSLAEPWRFCARTGFTFKLFINSLHRCETFCFPSLRTCSAWQYIWWLAVRHQRVNNSAPKGQRFVIFFGGCLIKVARCTAANYNHDHKYVVNVTSIPLWKAQSKLSIITFFF